MLCVSTSDANSENQRVPSPKNEGWALPVDGELITCHSRELVRSCGRAFGFDRPKHLACHFEGIHAGIDPLEKLEQQVPGFVEL